jgi:hypothetical protein
VHRGGRQAAHQLLGAGDLVPAVAPAEGLDGLGAADPEPGGTQRVRLLVEQVEGASGQGEGALDLAAGACRHDGLRQQIHERQGLRRGLLGARAARAGVDLGLVHGAQPLPYLLGSLLPQLHGALQQLVLLREGVPAARLDGRREHRGQRLGGVAAVVPVIRQARRALLRPYERRVGLQRLRVAAVERAGLARQQVLADGFAQQGVPEAVAVAVDGRQQHVGADGDAQRVQQLRLGKPADGCQQGVLHGGAALRGDPQHLLYVLGKGLDAHEQQIAE